MLQDVLGMVKMLKSESSDRHWKINWMIEDVQCMQDDYFDLKKRVELLKAFGGKKYSKYLDDDEDDTCSDHASDTSDALNDIQECVEEVKETLEAVEGFQHPCGGPGWRRVVYLDTDDPNSDCPSGWAKTAFDPTNPMSKESCLPSDPQPATCGIATFNVSEPYSQVCGRVEAISVGDVGGFRHFLNNSTPQPTVSDFFATGVILSRGSEHIWSFIAGTPPGDFFDASSGSGINYCPCLAGEDTFISTHGSLPDIVGSDYFCESGPPLIFDLGQLIQPNFFDYPLWDGLNCDEGSECCNHGAPPIFTKTLSSKTMEPLDARLCLENPADGGGVFAVSFMEIYVR